MAYQRLTKRKALELITPVVDNEVDEDTQIAFFRYLERDDEVRKQYESALRIKKIIADRCPVAHAPERLINRIREIIKKEDLIHSEPIFDMHCGATPCSVQKNYPVRPSFPMSRSDHFLKWGMITVAVAIAGILLGIVYQRYPSYRTIQSHYIEDYAYQQFTNHSGSYIPPTISTANLIDAEHRLLNQYDFSIHVPSLNRTTFQGVVYSDFISGYKVPMLEYYFPEKQQYIYIFAFRIKDLTKNRQLQRKQDAIEHCVEPEDFSVCQINGMHIVSWKWDSTWYAGISNQTGKELAAMVKPLNSKESSQ